jgi:hypothetical protein
MKKMESGILEFGRNTKPNPNKWPWDPLLFWG